jgi:hypothetical protein
MAALHGDYNSVVWVIIAYRPAIVAHGGGSRTNGSGWLAGDLADDVK